MEISYVKDVFHKYMVTDQLAAGSVSLENNDFTFEEKMLEGQDSSCLLKFHTQSTDGRKKYYYDISGLLSLSDYIEANKIDSAFIVKVVESFIEVFETLNSLLLDTGSLLVISSNIYVNISDKKLHFAYIPGYTGNYTEGMREIAGTLLNKVDYRENTGVLMAYEFNRVVSLPDFSLKMLQYVTRADHSSEIEKDCEEEAVSDRQGAGKKTTEKMVSADRKNKSDRVISKITDMDSVESVKSENDKCSAHADCYENDKYSVKADCYDYEKAYYLSDQNDSGITLSDSSDYRGKKGIFLIIIPAALYCLMIALLYISGYGQVLAHSLGIRTRYLMLAMIIAGFAFFFLICRIFGKNADEISDSGSKSESGSDHLSAGDFGNTDSDEVLDGIINDNTVFSFRDMSAQPNETTILGANSSGFSGETTILTSNHLTLCPRLISSDRNRTKDIAVMQMPSIIGSRKPEAQIVIAIPGVSRTHALIENDGDDILLSDLGSTNGTFINGEKLVPNRRYAIKRKDTVTFGDVSYTLSL